MNLSKQLEKLIEIRELHELSNTIVYIDDVHRQILRQRTFGTLENCNVYTDEHFEDFPSSHHIS